MDDRKWTISVAGAVGCGVSTLLLMLTLYNKDYWVAALAVLMLVIGAAMWRYVSAVEKMDREFEAYRSAQLDPEDQ